MSDLMLYGVLQIPYEMAMDGEIARFQYWQRGQQACEEMDKLRQQRDELLKACEKTISENQHLADGDDCTLIDIKRAVERCKT